MAKNFSIAAFAIVQDAKSRVLLCHRRDFDLWNLPGGGVEPGESPWDCVRREVEEETGLKVEVSRLIGVYSKPDKDEVVFSFECAPIGGALTLTEESDRIEYFDITEIPQNTSPKQVERIKDALAAARVPYFKVQTGKSSTELIKEGKI